MEGQRLRALITRTRKPIFAAPDDVARTTTALIRLAPYLDVVETKEALQPLRKFARHNPTLLQEALREVQPSPSVSLDGRCLALLARVVPTSPSAVTAQLWSDIAATTCQALAAQAWLPADLNTTVAHLRRHGSYDAAFVNAVVAYIAATLPTAAATELPVLTTMAASLPEVAHHPSHPLQVAAERCAAVADALTPGAIGHLCGQFNRTLCTCPNAAVAFQEEADRCAEKGDAFTAVQLFCFVARHSADHLSSDALIWLMERLSSEELDVVSVESLSVAVVRLPLATRLALRQELTDFVTYLATQVKELATQVSVAQGGLSGSTDVEAVQLFVSHVLEIAKALKDYPDVQYPAEFLAAADACVDLVEPLQEALLSAESSPYGLMVRLFDGPTDKCRQLASAMLHEASSQCTPFPALQVFRFLLAMGDHKLGDPVTLRYLRDQFAKTATDIPPVQLSTALRCLSSATADAATPAASPSRAAEATEAKDDGDEDEDDYEKERFNEFLQFCIEVARKHMSEGAPLRCVMATTEHLYKLGCRDAGFFGDVAAYIELKREAVAAEAESADTAATVCTAFGGQLLDQFPEVHEFLLDVEQRGVKGEAALTPSTWMHLHDPANTFEALTPQQQESADIIEKMVRTRADDTAALKALAERYLTLLPHTRPDDHKYFFGVFEEKVLKEDKLLKHCLDALVESDTLSRLSAPTIAGILQSLAAVRFQYFGSLKRFMTSITAEQWLSMEAAPLVQILSGMEKLSLRNPAVLRQIGGRLSELCRFLTPLNTAQAIHALQALGHNDPQLVAKLMGHAASSAKRFEEGSLQILFTTPSIHRLMVTAAVAQPLLLQASAKIHSPRSREKISAWVRKSNLPRELIESSTARLLIQSGSKGASNAASTLRLT